jgi:hypothetical protein
MRRWISALAILAVIAAGCGSGEEPHPATQEQGTTAAPSLGGSYERRLTRADIERTDRFRAESTADQEKPRPGRLELVLEEGTLTMTDVSAGVSIRQDFSATSDGAFRIGAYQAPDRGSFCGPEVSQTAAYTWKQPGEDLTLEAEHDECADRDSILSGRWKRR